MPLNDKTSPETPDVFLAYQKELKSGVSHFAITLVEKSRRIGMTWAVAEVAVEHSSLRKSDGGMNTFYMGYNLEMARDFINECANWARAYDAAAADVEEFVFTDAPNNEDGGKDIKAFRIKFASGYEIVALPSSPRVLRGKQGLVIIDEAAFHDDLEELLKAAFALKMWGGKIVILSTHDGVDNEFNQLVEKARKKVKGFEKYNLIRVTLDDALADGLYERICLVSKKEYSLEAEQEWRQELVDSYGDAADEELHVIPRSSSGGWLPYTLINARMQDGILVIRIERPDEFKNVAPIMREQEIGDWLEKTIKPLLDNLDPKLDYYLGGDIGRTGDGTTFWPLAKLQNTKLHTPFVVEIHNMPFSEQEQILFYIIDGIRRIAAIALDARGIGMQFAERCADRYGRHIVHEVMVTEGWYRDEMPPVKAALEDDALSVPRDADIERDLRSVQIIRGVPRIPDKRTKGNNKKQRHGETVIALAKAVFASKQKFVEYAYRAVPRPSAQADKIPSNKYSMPSRFGSNKRSLM
ncbi:MAG: hypothetical protein COB24_11915 [Hyphomicrobiales bacterium]|nr:MAG: hypothetical protein COB24_11915 [Hyphomicrobiales bacterium]